MNYVVGRFFGQYMPGPSNANLNFQDPAVSPGKGWEWRPFGSAPGSVQGAWYNPATAQSLHPDFSNTAMNTLRLQLSWIWLRWLANLPERTDRAEGLGRTVRRQMADVVHAELGESGLAWVRESLSAGRALSAAVLERAAGEAAKSVWAYVPASANLEANGTLFRFGGLFTANIARGAWFGTFTRLCLHRGTIIVEDELALPSDESLRGSVGTFAVVDSTVLYPKVLAPETTATKSASLSSGIRRAIPSTPSG